MRRRKYLTPVILIVVLVALPFIAKGVMYLQVKQAMDDLVTQSREHAEITYEGIETELQGAVSVNGLRIRPVGFEQTIQVARVRVASGDPWDFIVPGEWLGGGDEAIPEQMRIQALSVQVPMDTAISAALRQRLPKQSQPAAGCESLNLDPLLLQDMGFEELTLDLGMDYRLDPLAERVELAFDFDLLGIQSMSMSLRLTGLQPDAIRSRQMAGARLGMADIGVRMEPEFGQRLMAHCARQAGVPVEGFEETLIGEMRDNLRQSGIRLGTELQQAFEDYYREWGDIRLYVKPEQPLGLMQLAAVKPGQWVQTLGVSLFFNDRLVQDLDIDFDPDLMGGAGATAGASGDRPARARIVREFQPVSADALQQHIGKVVRIRPRGEPLRQGVLDAVVHGEARVRQRTSGGSLVSHVPLDSIDTAEVRVVRRIPLD